MGKKRKFNRFIKWIKSDLPEEKSSVLLLGVTKLSSPTLQRRTSANPQNQQNRPHTLHLEFPPFTPTFREKVPQIFEPKSILLPGPEPIHDSSLLQLNNHPTLTKTTSLCETKENSPPILETKSSSFSSKLPKKRVSFTDSKDIDHISNAREIALRNRDLNISIADKRDYNDNYPVSRDFELRSNSRENTPDYFNKSTRRNSIAVVNNTFDVGNILDEISSDLHIRHISRRNSDVEEVPSSSNQNTRAFIETIYKRFENLDEKEEDNIDDRLDYNRNKFNTTEKYYSENDLLDRSPKYPPRKLSAPITPIKVDDVNVFINEIIEELNIGPTFNRSRSQSKSDTFPSLSIPTFSTPSSGDDNDTSRLTSLSLTLNSESYNGPKSSSSESEPIPTPSILSSDSDVMIKNLEEADGSTAMDRSVDSIGSCSLDVDLSTDFSENRDDEEETISTDIWTTLSSIPNIFNLGWVSNLLSGSNSPT